MGIWSRLSGRIMERADWKNIALVLLFVFAVKCVIAQCFFFLSDEAYLGLWGKNISTGYYDHPPMAGWVAYALLQIGQSPLILRLGTILFSLAIGLGIFGLLKDYDRRKAYLVFLLFMFSPFDFMLFAVMTDAPLMFFAFFSIFFLFKAETKENRIYYLLSGICLGLAFLSKYFAIMVFAAYIVYFFAGKKNTVRVTGYGLLTIAATVLAAQNIAWNYHNGWPNAMHNFFNRIEKDANPAASLSFLAASAAYMLTPVVCYFLYKNRKRFAQCLWSRHFKLLVLIVAIPLVVLVLGSFIKDIRPHWIFFLMPVIFMIAGILIDPADLIKCIRFSFTFSMVQAVIVCAVPFFPFSLLAGRIDNKDFASFMLHLDPKGAAKNLDPYKDKFVMATQSYSISALLEYDLGVRTVVFGGGSQHGRQDDIYTDFKEFDGRDFAILLKDQKHISRFSNMFDHTETRIFNVQKSPIYVLLGYHFKYDEYRLKYLVRTLNKYYQVPAWLPYSQSYFHKKYDFDPSCTYIEKQYATADANEAANQVNVIPPAMSLNQAAAMK